MHKSVLSWKQETDEHNWVPGSSSGLVLPWNGRNCEEVCYLSIGPYPTPFLVLLLDLVDLKLAFISDFSSSSMGLEIASLENNERMRIFVSRMTWIFFWTSPRWEWQVFICFLRDFAKDNKYQLRIAFWVLHFSGRNILVTVLLL